MPFPLTINTKLPPPPTLPDQTLPPLLRPSRFRQPKARRRRPLTNLSSSSSSCLNQTRCLPPSLLRSLSLLFSGSVAGGGGERRSKPPSVWPLPYTLHSSFSLSESEKSFHFLSRLTPSVALEFFRQVVTELERRQPWKADFGNMTSSGQFPASQRFPARIR